MPNLLAGSWAKIERAEEITRTLSAEINVYLNDDPKPYRITKGLGGNGRQYVFTATSVRPLPLRFSVLAGEVVHHLRSSLDHLLSALVLSEGREISISHQFPICSSKAKFDDAMRRGRVAGISEDALKLIKTVQPYSSATPDDTVLHVIQDLNNQDKHRLLLVVAAVAQVGTNVNIGINESLIQKNSNYKPPAITGLFPPMAHRVSAEPVNFFGIDLDRSAPEFEAEIDVEMEVAFEKCGRVNLAPVIKILNHLIAGTRHTVGLFEPQF